MNIKRKTQAIGIFGDVYATAKALGVSPQAIYMWPDDLDQVRIDRIVGAAVRTGRLKLQTRPQGAVSA